MRPYDMGVLFDECADRGSGTRVRLDRPFDIAPDGGTDYGVGDLATLVTAASGWLAAIGTQPGDRVAILKPNHWDYDLLACAAIRLGAVPAQLSAHLPADSLAALLHRLNPAVLLTTTEFATLGKAFAGRVVTLDGPERGVVHLDLLRGHRAPPPRRPREHDPLVINHTSGTTGVPKLVVHSTSTIIRKLAGLESFRLPAIGVRRDDTLANASSYAHGRTFCWTASVFCLAPRRIVILSGQDPDEADVLLRRYPPTFVEALPATFVRWRPLLSRLDNPFRDVRFFLSTYDAMHPPVIRDYLHASQRRRPLWMQGWGQTETGPITFRFFTRKSLAAERERHPSTRDLGRAIPVRTRLKVVDPDTFDRYPAASPGWCSRAPPHAASGTSGKTSAGRRSTRGAGGTPATSRSAGVTAGCCCSTARSTPRPVSAASSWRTCWRIGCPRRWSAWCWPCPARTRCRWWSPKAAGSSRRTGRTRCTTCPRCSRRGCSPGARSPAPAPARSGGWRC